MIKIAFNTGCPLTFEQKNEKNDSILQKKNDKTSP